MWLVLHLSLVSGTVVCMVETSDNEIDFLETKKSKKNWIMEYGDFNDWQEKRSTDLNF